MNSELPIGIFDSGVGGLTVYRALHAHLPGERFVYLGDTARVPYGTKSLGTIERYAVENAGFLHAHGIKLLVVACNTASALALPAIARAVEVPVVGVIEPGARAAVETLGSEDNKARRVDMNKPLKVGVIATEATVGSHAYLRAIKRLAPHVEVVERACPLFVSLAEEGWAETDVARMVARDYLQPLRDENVSALVLGCTHYPVLREIIGEAIGAHVCLIDSGEAAAVRVSEVLAEQHLARYVESEHTHARSLCDDLDHFYVTDAAERFARVAERFLGTAPRHLEAVEVWGNDRLRVS